MKTYKRSKKTRTRRLIKGGISRDQLLKVVKEHLYKYSPPYRIPYNGKIFTIDESKVTVSSSVQSLPNETTLVSVQNQPKETMPVTDPPERTKEEHLAYKKNIIKEQLTYLDVGKYREQNMIEFMKKEVEYLSTEAKKAFEDAFFDPPEDPIQDAKDKFQRNLEESMKRCKDIPWEKVLKYFMEGTLWNYSLMKVAVQKIAKSEKSLHETIHKENLAELAAEAAAAASLVLEAVEKENTLLQESIQAESLSKTKETKKAVKIANRKRYLQRFITLVDIHLKVITYEEWFNYEYWIIPGSKVVRNQFLLVKLCCMYINFKIVDLYSLDFLDIDIKVYNQIFRCTQYMAGVATDLAVSKNKDLRFPSVSFNAKFPSYYINDMIHMLKNI